MHVSCHIGLDNARIKTRLGLDNARIKTRCIINVEINDAKILQLRKGKRR